MCGFIHHFLRHHVELSSLPAMSSSQADTQGDTESQAQGQSPFHRAYIYWETENNRRGKSRDAWVWISTSLRWIEIKSPHALEPEKFEDFRGQNRLTLERLSDDLGWEEVEAAVRPLRPQRIPGYALMVPGKVTLRRATPGRSPRVNLVMVLRNGDVRNSMVASLRILISPWKLLYTSLTNEIQGSGLSQNILRSLSTSSEITSINTNAPASSIAPDGFVDDLRNIGVITNTVDKFSAFIQSIYGFVKMCSPVNKESVEKLSASLAEGAARNAADVASAAQKASDIAKCVTIVGSLFQVVVVSATLIDLGFEMNRGSEELPRISEKVGNLQQSIVKSIKPVLKPNGKVQEELIVDMFKVQEEAFNILGKIEDQLMSSKIVRFLWADELKKIEVEMKRFEDSVLRVVQTGEIAGIKIEVKEVTSTVGELKLDTDRNTAAIQRMQSEVKVTPTEFGSVRKKVEVHSTKIADLESKCGPALPQLSERPTLTPFFVGREEELNRLNSILKSYGAAAIMQHGGVGKTQLVVAYAERAEKSNWISNEAYWVSMHGDESRAVSSLANFAEAITGRAFQEKDRQDANVVIRAVKHKLKSMKQKWLLVLDNVDDPEVAEIVGELGRFAGGKSVNGWVLVTSRRGGNVLWTGMEHEQQLKLDPLTREQSMIVLWRYKNNLLPSRVTDDEIREGLVELEKNDELEYRALAGLAGNVKDYGLGGLPLSLAQAGSFVYKMRITFAEYVGKYNCKRKAAEASEIFYPLYQRGFTDKRHRTVWTTFALNVETLGATARGVLSAFALFDVSPVPEKVVEELDPKFASAPVIYLEVVRGELVDEASLLQEYQSTDGRVSFGMHRMIREFVQLESRKEKELFEGSYKRAVMSLYTCVGQALKSNRDGTSDPPRTCGVSVAVFLPHSSKVLMSFSESGLVEKGFQFVNEALKLFFFTTHTLISQGRTVKASPVCGAQYKVLRAVLGDTSSDSPVIETLFQFGEVLASNGALNVATEKYSELIQKLQQKHGLKTDHRLIATALHNLGSVTLSKGLLNEAEQLYRKSLDMRHRIYGEDVDHLDVVASLHQMGNIARLRGLLDEAEQWYRKSLDMEQRVIGKDVDHPSVAASLHQMGMIAEDRGHLDEAEQWYLKGLEMEQRLHGEGVDHPGIAVSLHHMGIIAEHRGHLDKAEQFYLKSLDMKQRLHGEGVDHPDIASSLHQVGILADNRGHLAKAKQFYLKSLKMKQRLHGEDVDHTDVASSFHQIGLLSQHKGKLDKAEIWYRKSLDMLLRIHGEGVDHHDIAKVHHQLGMLVQELGKLDEAEQWYRKSLNMKQRLYGEDVNHPSVASSFHQLGLVAQLGGRLDEADQWYRKSLDMEQRLHGKGTNHPVIAGSFHQIGRIAQLQGLLDDAEHWYRKSLDMRQRIFGEGVDHPDVASSLHQIGIIAHEKELLDDAEQWYHKSLDMLQRVYGEGVDHPDIVRSFHQLELVAQQRKRWDEAEQWCRKSIDMRLRIQGDGIDYPNVANSMHLMGKYAELRGCLDEAEQWYRRNLDMRQRKYGDGVDHPDVAISFFDMGKVAQKRKRLEEAEQWYQKSLYMRQRIYGEGVDHPDVANCLHQMGFVALLRGLLDDAEQWYQKGHDMRERMHGEGADHPELVLLRQGLALICQGRRER